MKRQKVRIVGAGLIGTSIGLRLKELGYFVEISDSNSEREALARDLLKANDQVLDPDFTIVATPPASILSVLQSEFAVNPNSIFIDVGSVKTKLNVEVNAFPELSSRFVSTHPVAGREVSGAESAQSDLFNGRAWIIVSGSANLRSNVSNLISEIGATPYEMSPEEHDHLFARISHLPQLISVALVQSLSRLEKGIDLAGQGLRDMSRLAGSEGKLWFEILSENSREVGYALEDFEEALTALRESLASSDRAKVVAEFDAANHQRERITGKHGAKAREYTFLNVVIDDRPGQLASVFNECGRVNVNVEDLSLEHSPRQQTGLIRLALSKSDAVRLHSHLSELGWKVHLS